MSAVNASKTVSAVDKSTQQKRSYALDALRGYAIITMVLSGLLPVGMPYWMHHAQVPPPDFVFNGNLPGITWVDLVFPFFLFSMGAAIPFSLTSRLNKGIPQWKLYLSAVGRWLTLLCFSAYIVRTGPGGWGYKTFNYDYLLSLLAFVLVFAALTRFPESWNPKLRLGLKYGGWLGGFLLLCFVPNGDPSQSTLRAMTQPIFGSPLGVFGQILANLQNCFDPNVRGDWIIYILAGVSILGAVAWLTTRNNITLRLGILGFFMAYRLSLGAGGWIGWVDAHAKIPGMFGIGLGNYLHIVILGTIIGDLILKWMKQPVDPSAEQKSWSTGRLVTMIALMLGFIVLNLVCLMERWVPQLVIATIPMTLLGAWLFAKPNNSTEKLLKDFFGWGIVWLILGLAFEPFEGGIKKDSATMSYYYVTAGLAIFLLIAFTILIDIFKKKRWVQLVIDCGQNPMIAYIGKSVLVTPILFFQFIPIHGKWLGINEILSQYVFTPQRSPWFNLIHSVLVTLVVMLVTSFFTRKKLFWRT